MLMRFVSIIFAGVTFSGCLSGERKNMDQQQRIDTELKKIDGLLRDTGFAFGVAKHQDSAYYLEQGQAPPPFLPPGEEDATIQKSIREEKIATNLAQFYAVECGIGLLLETKGGTPVSWLEKIVHKTLDTSEQFVMNRFANATWKAGQPFRGLERIARPVFCVANFLPPIEIQKDEEQVLAAATILLDALKELKDAPKQEQLEKISQLEKDTHFAVVMARYTDTGGMGGGDGGTITKKLKEEKIAINIAGFYALECGLSWLAQTDHQLPSQTMAGIVADSLPAAQKLLFARLANATWKAGQPFRSLDRITRDNFTPAIFLSPEEIEKDHVQIKAAASLLLRSLR